MVGCMDEFVVMTDKGARWEFVESPTPEGGVWRTARQVASPNGSALGGLPTWPAEIPGTPVTIGDVAWFDRWGGPKVDGPKPGQVGEIRSSIGFVHIGPVEQVIRKGLEAVPDLVGPMLSDVLIREAAETAAPIFESQGWQWAPLGRPPTADEIEARFLRYVEDLEADLERTAITSGRLAVRRRGADGFALSIDLKLLYDSDFTEPAGR